MPEHATVAIGQNVADPTRNSADRPARDLWRRLRACAELV
jgi:hypothetical protein